MSNQNLILAGACDILWLVPLLESETAKLPDHPAFHNLFFSILLRCHCERSEAISFISHRDCFVAKTAPRNDTWLSSHLFSSLSVAPRVLDGRGVSSTIGLSNSPRGLDGFA
jgi:hypothetical protein